MNQSYKAAGPYEFTSEDVSEQVLTATREKAIRLLQNGDSMFRSCWVCNAAHVHLIETDEVVLECFGCGHFYLGGVDVTEFDDDEG